MDSLKSSFTQSFPLKPPSESQKLEKRFPPIVHCCLKPDRWALSTGNPKDLNKPKPKSKNPKNPLSDDNARRIIKAKARYLSVLRRNQGSRVQTPKWIKRTPEQMLQYLEDDRNGHLYGRHVVAAIKRVRSTSGMRQGDYDMREVMSSFVAKLSFRDMSVVLKEQKNWRQVRDFFAWMKLQLCYRPSVMIYTIVLRACGQAGKIKLAEETFLEMLESGCEPDEVACGTMLCSYARWGRHQAMLSFFSAVEERGIIPPTTVFNFMMSSLQKKSLHTDAIYVWRKMADKGVIPNQFTYTVVISSLVKGDLAEEAFKTFIEMKNLGFLPEESTYSLLICVRSKQGDKTEALHLYEDMRSLGILPSNFTCASLLALYYRTADYSRACSLFNEMEQYGVVADEVIYGLLIRIYGKLGLYEDAQKTFTEIETLGLLTREKTYTTMAQVHLNFGNFEEALDVMEQMKSNSISYSRFSQFLLLQCYVAKRDLTSAEFAYQALSMAGRPDATCCKYILNLYLTLGLSEKATSFVDQIRKDQIEFDEELFMIVMRIYCKEGMIRGIKQLLQELSGTGTFDGFPLFRAFFLAINGECSTLAEYVNLLDPLGESGETAVELMMTLCLVAQNETEVNIKLDLMLQTKIGVSVGNRIICKLSQGGDLLTAQYLYNLMIKLGCKLEDAARASLICMYAKLKKLEQARKVFTAAAGCATDGSAIYSSMIDAYITCGKEEEAYVFYNEQTMKGHNFGPVSVSILVKALTSCAKHSEALEIISNCFHNKVELDTVAYNTFLKAMLEAGKLRFAIRIFERMVSSKIAQSIQTYNTMISVYARCRNLEKAVEMFSTAESIGLALDEKIYTNMISTYGKAGKVDAASALFTRMQDEGIKPGQVSYNIMISVFASDGCHHEAEKLLLSMQRNGCSPDSHTYLTIIRAYTKRLKYSEAENVLMQMQKEGISVSCAHFNLLLSAFAQGGLMKDAQRIYANISSAGLNPDVESRQIMLRGYLYYGHVEEGIYFVERECCNITPDRFVMSASVHLYESASNELRAKELLNTMNALGVPFLNNLLVGSKAQHTRESTHWKLDQWPRHLQPLLKCIQLRARSNRFESKKCTTSRIQAPPTVSPKTHHIDRINETLVSRDDTSNQDEAEDKLLPLNGSSVAT